MEIYLFVIFLVLSSFEGRYAKILNHSRFPKQDNVQNISQQIAEKYSFMAVIVYGRRVLCAGTAISETWLITIAHCVSGNLKEDNLVRFGSMRIRLGADPIGYKKIKEVAIKTSKLADEEYYIPVVSPEGLLPVYSVVEHPEYIYQNNYQRNKRFASADVTDLALVEFKRGPKIFIPSLVAYPEFSGMCVAAGWALYVSKVPQEPHNIYEFQCQPSSGMSAEQLPRNIKEAYKMNKICSLLPGSDEFTNDIVDGDKGGPLLCNNKLQGIISHYYVRSNGDYFSFFYDITQFLPWIKKKVRRALPENSGTFYTTLRTERNLKKTFPNAPRWTTASIRKTTSSRWTTFFNRLPMTLSPRITNASPRKTTTTTRHTTTTTRWTTIYTRPTTSLPRRKDTTSRWTIPTPRYMATTNDLISTKTTTIVRPRTKSTRRTTTTSSRTTSFPRWTLSPTKLIDPRKYTFTWTGTYPIADSGAWTRTRRTFPPRQDTTEFDPTADVQTMNSWYQNGVVQNFGYITLGMIGLCVSSFIIALFLVGWRNGFKCYKNACNFNLAQFCRKIRRK